MASGRERMNLSPSAKCVDAMEQCVKRVSDNLDQVREVVSKLNPDDRIGNGVDGCTSVVRELVNVLGDLKSYAEQFHHTGTSLANAIHFQLTEQAKQNTKFAMAAESLAERLTYLECSMTNMLGPAVMRHPPLLSPYHVPPVHCWPFARPEQLPASACNGTARLALAARSVQPAPPLFFRRQVRPSAVASSEDAAGEQTRWPDRPIKRRHRKPAVTANDAKPQQAAGMAKTEVDAQVGDRVDEATVQVSMIPLLSDGNRMRNFVSRLAYDQAKNQLSLVGVSAGESFSLDLGKTTSIKGADHTIGLHTGRETFQLRFDKIEAMERYATLLARTAHEK